MRVGASRAIGRNLTRIESSSDGLIFVKEIAGPSEDASRRYHNCLRFDKHQREHLSRRISPELLHHDDDSLQLIYPYISDAVSLQELLSDWRVSGWHSQHQLVDVLDNVAVLMANLHAHAIPEINFAETDVRMDQHESPRKFRWLTPEEYEAASGGELECWRVFHHDEVLHRGMEDWVTSSLDDARWVLVHGDMRPDQFLLVGDEILLLDWEEFGVGLGVIDLAGIVGSLLFESLDTTFKSPFAGEFDMLAAHQHYMTCGYENLQVVSPVIARFVATYSNACGHRIDPVMLGRHMGAYLLERVVGRSMLSMRLSASDKAIAGVARNAICRPDLISALVTEAVSEYE